MASNNNGGRSGNHGKTRVMIAAPGVRVVSTYPMHDVARGGYHTMTGSSMAAPVISGVAALIMSARIERNLPQLSPPQIIDIIMSTVQKVSTSANNNIAGGIVDAYAAVTMALTYCSECDNVGCSECRTGFCEICDRTDATAHGVFKTPTFCLPKFRIPPISNREFGNLASKWAVLRILGR